MPLGGNEMTLNQPQRSAVVAALCAAAFFAGWTSAEAAERYVAELTPLNADKLGSSASGTATFEIENGKLKTTIELKGLPPNIAHLQHFHGFVDKDAACATSKDDVNGDGYIDLLETEPVSGVTMLPFHAHPATLEIPSDTYPVADGAGNAHYEHTDDVAELEKALHGKFKTSGLKLSERVVIVHTVPNDTKLPDSAKSLAGVPAQVTIPLACGKIEPVK
jgi:hypothetical protein